MQKTIKLLPKSEVEVTVSVPWARVQEIFNRVLINLSAKAELQGFRPGKAPIHLVEEKVGKAKIWNEALQILLSDTLGQALTGEPFVVIDYPRFNITQYGDEKDLNYVATLTVSPKIEVKDYAKVKIKKQQLKKVEEKAVEEALKHLFTQWKQTKNKQGQQDKGDLVDASGKPLFSTKADQPNDEFAKEMGAKDLFDLRVQIKKELEERALYEADKEFEDKVLGELLKRIKVDLPEVLVSEELNRILVRLHQTIEQMGSTFDEFLKSQKKTIEELRVQWRPQAEKNVTIELTLQYIGKREGITVDDAEVEKQLAGHAQHESHDHEREKAIIAHALRQAKTLAWLKNNAVRD